MQTTATTPAAPIFTAERIRESHQQDVITADWVLRNGVLHERCHRAEGIGRCYLPVADERQSPACAFHA